MEAKSLSNFQKRKTLKQMPKSFLIEVLLWQQKIISQLTDKVEQFEGGVEKHHKRELGQRDQLERLQEKKELELGFEEKVVTAIREKIEQCMLFEVLPCLNKDDVESQLKTLIVDDLISFAERDPAAHQSCSYVLDSCLSFQAVMSYRIAHNILDLGQIHKSTFLKKMARKLSESAKIKTGIEIHPAAKIGKRFVLDHGFGTVIGETCEIGDDCYVLQEVVLGATSIAKNLNEKRHPTIGNRVEIGAFAKVLGAVSIGDDVSIGAGCLVKQNLPPRIKVVRVNEYQIFQKESTYNEKNRRVEIYGFNIVDRSTLICFGVGFSAKNRFSLVDNDGESIDFFDVKIIELSDTQIRLKISIELVLEDLRMDKLEGSKKAPTFKNIGISMASFQDDSCSVLIYCYAVQKIAKNLLESCYKLI